VRVSGVGSVRVSPDGRRVVFAVSEAIMDETRSRSRTHIYLADSDGKESVPLTSGEASGSLSRSRRNQLLRWAFGFR
jgi:dipeptidyl aminopeptidase/acylaminoacyl peptidase